jgi:hypothetical protein
MVVPSFELTEPVVQRSDAVAVDRFVPLVFMR